MLETRLGIGMQKLNARGVHLTYVSLFLVGVMWVFPFLHYRHQYPLTTFYQEWWSALLGVLALFPLVLRDYWQKPQIPRIVLLPVGLIGVILLQYALGMIVYFDQVMLYVLYLLFAGLLIMLGARLRDCLGMHKMALVLAIFLLTGAELGAIIGILQHYRWSTPLSPVIVMKVGAGVFGNMAQPNHYADYIALGLVSLGLLQPRLKLGYVLLLSAPLLLVMTLSGSRSAWLYLLLITVLAWWWTRRDALQRPLLRYCQSLLAGFFLMHLLVQLPFMAGAVSNYNTVERLVDEASGGIRLFLWHEASLIFFQSPWLGVGFGQFAWQHFQLLPQLPPNNLVGLYNNAHNLVFQLAAETGVAGLLVLFFALGSWLYGLYRVAEKPGAEYWWGYAALGVLGVHSLLEYPLWYSYFIAVAAVLLGALDVTRYRLELRLVGRLSIGIVLALGFVTLMQFSVGYHQLERLLMIRNLSERSAFERMRSGMVELHGKTLLAPYSELFLSSMIEINPDHLKEKLELNGRVMRFTPIGMVVYRHALLLAQDGQFEQAKTLMKQAKRSYREDLPVTISQMRELADKDPAHFSALLEFALENK